MRGLHDKRQLLAKLRIAGSENWLVVDLHVHVASGELSSWGVLQGIVVLVGNSWTLFLSGRVVLELVHLYASDYHSMII